MTERASDLWKKLKPFAVRDLSVGTTQNTVTTSGGGISVHDIDGAYHTGTLSWSKVNKSGSDIADIEARDITDLEAIGNQYDVVYLSATNTIGIETPSDDGTGGNVLLRTDGNGDLIISDLTSVNVTATGDINATNGNGSLLWDESVGGLWVNNGSLGSMGGTTFKVINNTSDTASNTVWIKQIASQTGDLLKITDSSEQDLIILTSSGDLESGNPAFVSGSSGWQITAEGNAEFNDLTARGVLHSVVFSTDEWVASNGTEIIAESAAVVYEDVDCSGTVGGSITIKIEHPTFGPAAYFAVGDVLRIKAMGRAPDPYTAAGIATGYLWDVTSTGLAGEPITTDIWLTVTSIDVQTDYQAYTCDIEKGQECTIRKATAVINYGQRISGPSDTIDPGHIVLTADQNYAPYIAINTMDNDTPWTNGFAQHVRIGKLRGVKTQFDDLTKYGWGIAASSNFANSTNPHFVMSSEGTGFFGIDMRWSPSSGVESGKIYSDGAFEFAKDLSDGDAGAIRFESGGPYESTERNSALWSGMDEGDLMIGAPNKQYMKWDQSTGRLGIFAGPLQTGAVTNNQLPQTPGLYMSAVNFGYWDGIRFRSQITNDGSFKFGFSGPSEDRSSYPGRIEFIARSGIFGGYGSDGNYQWKSTLEDGKFYAGGDAVIIDADGLTITDASTTGIVLPTGSLDLSKQITVGSSGRIYGLRTGNELGSSTATFVSSYSSQFDSSYLFLSAYGGVNGSKEVQIQMHAQTSGTDISYEADDHVFAGDVTINDGTTTNHFFSQDSAAHSYVCADGGNLGVGTNSPSFGQIQVLLSSSQRGIYINNNDVSFAYAGLEIASTDNGSSYGPFIKIGRNDDGSNAAPGSITLLGSGGWSRTLWVADTGDLHIGAGDGNGITSATKGSGVAVGTQTSSEYFKNLQDHVGADEWANALARVQRAATEAVYRFTYKRDRTGEVYQGVVLERGAEHYGMDKTEPDIAPHGKSLNVVNAVGDLMQANAYLAKRIDELERKIGAM